MKTRRRWWWWWWFPSGFRRSCGLFGLSAYFFSKKQQFVPFLGRGLQERRQDAGSDKKKTFVHSNRWSPDHLEACGLLVG